MKPSLSGLFAKVSVILCSLFLSLFLIELFVRIYDDFRQTRRVLNPEFFKGASVIDFPELNYNEAAVSTRKPKGSFRILSFGDSFSFGIVKRPYTYHSIASRELTERAGRNVELINVGEAATSFYQYMNAYRLWGPLIEHDAVLVNIYLGNDVLDVAYSFVKDDTPIQHVSLNLDFDMQSGLPYRIHVPKKFHFRFLDYAWLAYLKVSGQLRPGKNLPPEYSYATNDLSEETFFKASFTHTDNMDLQLLPKLEDGYIAVIQFARFLSEIRQQGYPVYVMLAAGQYQVDQKHREKVLERFPVLRDKTLDLFLSAFLIRRIFGEVDSRIRVFSLAETLSCGLSLDRAMYFRTDTHWSVEGNRAVAQQVATTLGHSLFKLDPLVREGFENCGRTSVFPDDGFELTDAREKAYQTWIQPLFAQAPPQGRRPKH